MTKKDTEKLRSKSTSLKKQDTRREKYRQKD